MLQTGGARPCTQIERGGRVAPAAAGSKAKSVGSCSGSSQGPRQRDPQPRRVRTLAAALGHWHDPRTSDGQRHQGSLYAGLHQRQLHHQDLQPPPPAFICIRAAKRAWASTSTDGVQIERSFPSSAWRGKDKDKQQHHRIIKSSLILFMLARLPLILPVCCLALQMRQLKGEVDIFSRADGSVLFEMGNTRVITAVYGP
ncbi:uncharacterized protein LOC119333226 [Triticum dicoccoides]|uniref:uncharacterized protein LOC119333226 n=1 Tax=Triticum dicoccoides TaxID=85692 RepID=UPI00189123FD|nr:uncharacterized protein LOC119333226 [Triticum dicoccoides]